MCHCVTNCTTQPMYSLPWERMKIQARLTCAHTGMGQTKTQRRRRKSHKNHARSTCASLSLSLTYSLTLSVNCALSSWRALLGSAQLGSSLVAAPGPILNVCTPRQYRYQSLRSRLRRRRRIAAALRIALKEHSRPSGSDKSFVFGFVLVFVSLSRLEKCRLIAITESKSERKNERKKSRVTETTTTLTHTYIHTQRQTGAHMNKSRTENVCNTKIRWRVSAADVFQKPTFFRSRRRCFFLHTTLL